MRVRLLAVTAGLASGLLGVVAVLHTPLGRPLMRRLGMACPATKVSPAQVEAVRQRALATLRGDRPSPARPALGQALDVARAGEVAVWARRRGLSCAESARPVHTIKCAPGIATLDPKAPPAYQLVFAFAPDGRLVSVDRLQSTLTAAQASRLFAQTADLLDAALGPGRLVGDATPAYLAGGALHTARLAYRFSDYVATVTAVNVGSRVILHEQYESAGGRDGSPAEPPG